ncbi:hypothetical protein C1645_831849 [Glomus cerebriforme]|uniref:F-box domain-containing protein n=1 Tax=Glomus cerebriforme TaxID=658196 RepID=A0A397SKU3_9GLOM|nr:hypothetical protein C1645_831849 [Glomus cerebriforme]
MCKTKLNKDPEIYIKRKTSSFNTLSKLKSIDSSFLFSKFVNLETLILYQSYDSEDLRTAIFSKLQILELKSRSLNIAINIIQNTNVNLWKVKIDDYSFEASREYIQAIYKCCPNIKYASIYLNNQNLDDDVVNFLINCQHLEAIEIIIYDENFDGIL